MPTPTQVLSEFEKQIITSAIDLVIEKVCGGMNGDQYLSEIADTIDQDREMTRNQRMVELYSMAQSIKLKVR